MLFELAHIVLEMSCNYILESLQCDPVSVKDIEVHNILAPISQLVLGYYCCASYAAQPIIDAIIRL